MTTRIHYNSPKHNTKLLLTSRPTSQLTEVKQATPKKEEKNPQTPKLFQRKQTFKALERKKSEKSQQKRKFSRQNDIKANMFKGSEYFGNNISKLPEKIIRDYHCRDRRADTQIFRSQQCLPSLYKNADENNRLPKNRQKLFNEEDEVKLLKQFNESLLKKNSTLNESNIILREQNEQLRCRVEILEEKCKVMQEQIQECSEKQKKYCEESSQQKSINRCLEDIILQLNARIESLINEPDNVTQDTCDEGGQMEELKKQNYSLKEDIMSLKSRYQKLDLEMTMLKREKYEVGKQKNIREKLQTRNKALNRKLEDLQKVTSIVRVKSQGKMCKNSDLDYSVSFDFDR